MRTTKHPKASLHPNSLTTKTDEEEKNQIDTKYEVIHKCVMDLGRDKKFKNRLDWNNPKSQRYCVVGIAAGISGFKQKCLRLWIGDKVVAQPTLNRV